MPPTLKRKAPTPKAVLTQINTWFDKHCQLFGDLSGRWFDESEYEDINDYRDVVQKIMPKGWSITKMLDRSAERFGFEFHIDVVPYNLYAVTSNASEGTVSWERRK